MKASHEEASNGHAEGDAAAGASPPVGAEAALPAPRAADVAAFVSHPEQPVAAATATDAPPLQGHATASAQGPGPAVYIKLQSTAVGEVPSSVSTQSADTPAAIAPSTPAPEVVTAGTASSAADAAPSMPAPELAAIGASVPTAAAAPSSPAPEPAAPAAGGAEADAADATDSLESAADAAAAAAAAASADAKPSVPVIPVSEEALAAATAAVKEHHRSPEKTQPAAEERRPPETPIVVKTMTGVGEGFNEPADSTGGSKSAADIVAAAVADSAPSPSSQDYSAFSEAVGEEVQMAQAASDEAKAIGEPRAADDILAHMTAAASPPPSPAPVKAGGGSAKAGEDSAAAAKDASTNNMASVAQPATDSTAGREPVSQPASPAASPIADKAAERSSLAPPTPSLGAEPEVAAAADSSPAGTNAALPVVHASPVQSGSGVATESAAEPAASPAAASLADPAATEPVTAGAPATPEPAGNAAKSAQAATAFGSLAEPASPPASQVVNSSSPFVAKSQSGVTPASPQATTPTGTGPLTNGEAPRSPSSSLVKRIAALKSNSVESAPSTPTDLPPASPTTSSAVKARLAALRSNSQDVSPHGSPIQRATPGTPTRKWKVEGIDVVSSPPPPPATGEVVEEEVQPKTALKSFWESRSPIGVVAPKPLRPSSAENSNTGKKWQVKLNMPLASGKVSDLSFFKTKDSTLPPEPIQIEYQHKIGEATFPIDELKGMSGNDGIDPINKELYLTTDAFQEAFGMDQDAYKGKPKWRQVLLKKKAGLF